MRSNTIVNIPSQVVTSPQTTIKKSRKSQYTSCDAKAMTPASCHRHRTATVMPQLNCNLKPETETCVDRVDAGKRPNNFAGWVWWPGLTLRCVCVCVWRLAAASQCRTQRAGSGLRAWPAFRFCTTTVLYDQHVPCSRPPRELNKWRFLIARDFRFRITMRICWRCWRTNQVYFLDDTILAGI